MLVDQQEINLPLILEGYVEKSNDLVQSMYQLTHAQWIFVHFMIACVDTMRNLDRYMFEFTPEEIVAIVNYDGVRRLESTKRVDAFLSSLRISAVYFRNEAGEFETGRISGMNKTPYGTYIFWFHHRLTSHLLHLDESTRYLLRYPIFMKKLTNKRIYENLIMGMGDKDEYGIMLETQDIPAFAGCRSWFTKWIDQKRRILEEAKREIPAVSDLHFAWIPHKKAVGKGIARVEIIAKRKTPEELQALDYQLAFLQKFDVLKERQRKVEYDNNHPLFASSLFAKLQQLPSETKIQRNKKVFEILYQAEQDADYKSLTEFTITKCTGLMKENPKLHPGFVVNAITWAKYKDEREQAKQHHQLTEQKSKRQREQEGYLRTWEQEKQRYITERTALLGTLKNEHMADAWAQKNIELASIAHGAPKQYLAGLFEAYTAGKEVKRLQERVEEYLLVTYAPIYASYESFVQHKHGLIKEGQTINYQPALLVA